MSEHQIFNMLVDFFEADDWNFQWVEGMSVLSMGFDGQNGRWTCYAQAREPEQQFVFYSVLPVNVPEEHRMRIVEFLMRANCGMIIGNFEMDFSDGEVRYKTSLDVEGGELSMPLIRQMVYANIIITDRYFPGIMQAMYSDVSPEYLIAQIEQFDELDLGQADNQDESDDDFFDDEDDPFAYLDEYDDDFFDDEDDDLLDDDDPSMNGSSPSH